ncbi:MAG: pyruvate, phosphate dikinase [Firmicutes bacterium]|nr:pyruvate, phosphate dikinase [Bacillota bacterium]
MSKKYVYLFTEGKGLGKELLGGKGANLAEMTSLGMPVPQGFVVSTEACAKYTKDGKKISSDVEKQIFEGIKDLETQYGKKFGCANDPLLVSVRSGSRASMPGMMDTILNLGLNEKSVEGLAKKTDNPRFAYDSYRRFIQMFSDVVMEQKKEVYDKILKNYKDAQGYKLDTDMTADDWKQIVKTFKENYKQNQGSDFPEDPKIQLLEATKAVFRSWDNERANIYRLDHGIPYEWGTAVNIQVMVFGNKGNTSGTGVAFTRDPSTGERKLYGEYLMNAQGEDVVAGIRTPNKIEELEKQNPAIYKQFCDTVYKLEKHYKDMQDTEFTIEDGKLYMLQTRSGKRTAKAAVKIAVDLVNEKMIDIKTALCMIDPKQLDALLHPTFIEKDLKACKPCGYGLPASPGAACGTIVFSAKRAAKLKEADPKAQLILVRHETSPEDIAGMKASQGILTATGGMTSHAAVVARGMGTCCVCGCTQISEIDEEKGIVVINGKSYKEGDWLSLDGTAGNIYEGKLPTEIPGEITGDFATIMEWADKHRALKIRTNADTPNDTKQAIIFGAEGIGLCRTEHMFFDHILAMREMIVSKTLEQRQVALAKLLPIQRDDFKGIFTSLKGMPATVRLLDPPLHEFVPHTDEDIQILANEMGLDFAELKKTIESLHEFNPMMGHRGCRLSVTYPEIAAMQTRAIIEAAIEVSKETGVNVTPEIMIPLIGEIKELKFVKDIVVATADSIIKESGSKIKYMVGTMIEIPRAALLADEIASEAEFFSFGTNDLTQMTYGFSRDDAGKFLEDYIDKKIFEADPFTTLDQKGVGQLITMSVEKGRAARKNLKIGVCGEHGGDPASIMFFHKAGLEYVSCSPFRVPIARLSAAQANIKFPRKK